MKRFLLLFSFFIFSTASAEKMDCGSVTINKILAGPRHGAMMKVSNNSCGSGGYVCLDPDGEYMSQKKSDRLFSFVLSSYMAGKEVALYVYTDIYVSACGNYPVVEDVRSVN